MRVNTDACIVELCRAGYETTSVALTFSIFAIASFPEVEQRVLAEVDAFWYVALPDVDLCPCVLTAWQASLRMVAFRVFRIFFGGNN